VAVARIGLIARSYFGSSDSGVVGPPRVRTIAKIREHWLETDASFVKVEGDAVALEAQSGGRTW
jgi:hypothetical protein